MRKTIQEISNIQTGLFAKPSGTGELVYLQARHFDESGLLLHSLYPDLMPEDVSEKHILKDGDVLFAAKGTKNFAAVYENRNMAAVASTSFFVIRITENQVLPEYLAWYLNNQSTQALLKGKATGTAMPSISKHVLENLEIPVPSIQTQKTILEIHQLRIREKALKQDIETLREKQIQQQIIKALK